jgi:hypothetical protein
MLILSDAAVCKADTGLVDERHSFGKAVAVAPELRVPQRPRRRRAFHD